MIAWFGTGLLGANFVRALLARGEQVRVWNRTAEKARALEAEGARAFADAAEAARGAARIHLTLSDDAAVEAVLEALRPGLGEGAVIVDHTTTSPAGAAARARAWAERGVAFQNAPVFMGPVNAREATGIIMASGERALFERLEPALAAMTGKVIYLGPDPARASLHKLMGNLLILALGAGLADMLKLAKANGISAEAAAAMFDWFAPVLAPGPRLARILANQFDKPSWELSMARKDAALMLDCAGAGELSLTLIPALAAEMDRWIGEGHGREDWLVIAKPAL